VVITVLDGGGANPAPTLSAISPSSLVAGSGTYTMTVSGINLMASSTITWTGQIALSPLTFTGGTEITVSVPASYVASAGTPQVRVVNPSVAAVGGGTSSPQTVAITAATAGGGSGGGGSSAGGGGGGCGVGALSALMMLGTGLGLGRRILCGR